MLPQRREPAHVAGLEANVPNFIDKSGKKKRAATITELGSEESAMAPKDTLGCLPTISSRSRLQFFGRKALLGKIGEKDEVIQTHLGSSLSMRGTPQYGLCGFHIESSKLHRRFFAHWLLLEPEHARSSCSKSCPCRLCASPFASGRGPSLWSSERVWRLHPRRWEDSIDSIRRVENVGSALFTGK